MIDYAIESTIGLEVTELLIFEECPFSDFLPIVNIASAVEYDDLRSITSDDFSQLNYSLR